MADIGYRYQPGESNRPNAPGQAGPGRGTTPQEAIRTLSLRVPQTQSVPGIAPLPLLNATGGGGSDLSRLIQALLDAFSSPGEAPGLGLGPGLDARRPQMRASAAAAPPRITPRSDMDREGGFTAEDPILPREELPEPMGSYRDWLLREGRLSRPGRFPPVSGSPMSGPTHDDAIRAGNGGIAGGIPRGGVEPAPSFEPPNDFPIPGGFEPVPPFVPPNEFPLPPGGFSPAGILAGAPNGPINPHTEVNRRYPFGLPRKFETVTPLF